MGMDELILAMSNEDLAELKTKYTDNESVTKLIDGILKSRENAEAEVKAKVEFEKGITKLFAKLPHPEDVHNVYARWGEVEVEDATAEGEQVDVYDAEGNAASEMRYPKHMEHQWIVQVNKAVKVSSGGSGEAKTSKRAITVMRHNPDGADEAKGNYGSASKACEALGLTIGGDSANRVLTREGYYTKPYDGTDYS